MVNMTSVMLVANKEGHLSFHFSKVTSSYPVIQSLNVRASLSVYQKLVSIPQPGSIR